MRLIDVVMAKLAEAASTRQRPAGITLDRYARAQLAREAAGDFGKPDYAASTFMGLPLIDGEMHQVSLQLVKLEQRFVVLPRLVGVSAEAFSGRNEGFGVFDLDEVCWTGPTYSTKAEAMEAATEAQRDARS